MSENAPHPLPLLDDCAPLTEPQRAFARATGGLVGLTGVTLKDAYLSKENSDVPMIVFETQDVNNNIINISAPMHYASITEPELICNAIAVITKSPCPPIPKPLWHYLAARTILKKLAQNVSLSNSTHKHLIVKSEIEIAETANMLDAEVSWIDANENTEKGTVLEAWEAMTLLLTPPDIYPKQFVCPSVVEDPYTHKTRFKLTFLDTTAKSFFHREYSPLRLYTPLNLYKDLESKFTYLGPRPHWIRLPGKSHLTDSQKKIWQSVMLLWHRTSGYPVTTPLTLSSSHFITQGLSSYIRNYCQTPERTPTEGIRKRLPWWENYKHDPINYDNPSNLPDIIVNSQDLEYYLGNIYTRAGNGYSTAKERTLLNNILPKIFPAEQYRYHTIRHAGITIGCYRLPHPDKLAWEEQVPVEFQGIFEF